MYVWVSTDQQNVDTQRYEVLASPHTREFSPLQCVEETTSGRLAWRERAVGRLLPATTQGGEVVLCTKVRRMARSTFQGLEMIAMPLAQHDGIPHERVDVYPPPPHR